MAQNNAPGPVTFNVSYAGLVTDINFASVDPCGRTDLLRILDRAQIDGCVAELSTSLLSSQKHRLTIKQYHIEVENTISKELELCVPLHRIASVGYVDEASVHLVCINISPHDSSPQNRDIAVLCLPTKALAETICSSMNSRFQTVYKEGILDIASYAKGSQLSSPSGPPNGGARTLESATTIHTYTTSEGSNEAANEYVSMVNSALSREELHEFNMIIKRYWDRFVPLRETAFKTLQLFSPRRGHLVAQMRHLVRPEDQLDFHDFLIDHGIATSGDSHSSSVQVGSRTFDTHELQKLIPQMEDAIQRKDQQLKQQQNAVDGHMKRIAELEAEVTSLQRECDKLRSVLEQKATSAAASPGMPSSPGPRTDQLGNDLTQKAVLPNDAAHRSKKMAVSAEPTNFEQTKQTALEHHHKTAGSKQLIRDAVQKNDFLKQLAKEQIIELVECMYEMRARAGQWVIQEGEPGDRLFVVAEGELQVSREGQLLGQMRSGTVMGELAILYNCTRTASVQAISDVQLWVLDRSVFQMITQRLGMERHSLLMTFLSKVTIFENLSQDRISKMADVMDQDYYAGGHHIIRQGEKGDAFFVINSGQVKVTQLVEGEPEPREIRTLGQGDFFGERALLGEEVRTANIIAQAPGVEVLTLDRDSFLKLIGDLEALKKDYGDTERLAKVIHEPPSPVKDDIRAEFELTKLSSVKRLATLGVGGFGRVELVCLNGDKSRTFALKALKKKHIVDTRQQEHIFAERNIMMETSSDWIVKLFKTFRDTKYVYMLLEVCLGGELWTTLRDRGHFDDYTARFYVACVLEGLEYLHRKSIVYRDLKPENCLLTNTGYLKLVDFGFAKKLASGRKTWTFCGTPEYVSPEIILNKGHDQAADYWALGIYICELMLGRPPFQASDPMKTYTLILKGVDALEIPNRRIGKTATALVKKLCRDNPGERLGSGSGGVNDIRKHRWFMGFDWEGLRSRTLKAPILPKVSNPADVTNFDNYPPDLDVPPDEFSGWDEGF